ncbi:MAG: type II toxin-antitoxin system prevent-host-death family antitoxin [Oscillospiraceae bacterium]|nr:type II toxin-antitoxin system prevent-host-death family antitoxin [Oscillospiraceae bacterium]
MYNTYARPARDLRNNYADIMRMVREHNRVLITQDGKSEAVLINAEDYAEYEEFLHNRYIVSELKKTEERIAAGEVGWISADEFFERERKSLGL